MPVPGSGYNRVLSTKPLHVTHSTTATAYCMGYQIVPLESCQCVQNMCAHLVLRRGKRDSISQCLNQLNWLPIKSRITFKVLVLTYKLLHGEGPGYLKKLLTVHKSQRQGLRSSKRSDLLAIPITKRKTFAARLFSVASPPPFGPIYPVKSEDPTHYLALRTD